MNRAIRAWAPAPVMERGGVPVGESGLRFTRPDREARKTLHGAPGCRGSVDPLSHRGRERT